jgi:Zn-finger nucleic acid-binding protein
VSSRVLVACPSCADSHLVEFDVRENVRVEFCQTCKGMLVDEFALEQLAGTSAVEALTEPSDTTARLRPCLRCNTLNWQRRVFASSAPSGLESCGTCGMIWLEAGGLERLRERSSLRQRLSSRAAPQAPALVSSEHTAPAAAAVAHEFVDSAERSSFDRGVGNLVGIPLLMALSLLFCSSGMGQFFAALVGMPFHELGHALASWLSSRFAVPLPFFTIWHDDQSLAFGLVVAGSIGWFGYHASREKSRFGVLMAGILLSAQVGMSWLVPARFTLMLQILGGALGELVLAALLLVAFHFPLPDRLRWDFWRWPALAPGSICFVHALLVWIRATGDPSSIPWGSAIGDDSDGDMNRLVRDFGWSAAEIAAFYLRAGLLSTAGLLAAYALAWQRHARNR